MRVGYLTAAGRYLRLLQSDADREALLAVETGGDPVAGRAPVTSPASAGWSTAGRAASRSGRRRAGPARRRCGC